MHQRQSRSSGEPAASVFPRPIKVQLKTLASDHVEIHVLLRSAERYAGPLALAPATYQRRAPFRLLARSCAAVALPTSMRAVPGSQGGVVARRVRWHVPA